MAREPRVFDRLFLSMMRAAEVRGGVPEALLALSEHYEVRHRLVRQTRSALIYPIIVLVIASGVALLLSAYVLPILVEVIADLQRRKNFVMPRPAVALMAIGAFMRTTGWWAIPAAIVGTLAALALARRTRVGKAVLDELTLWVPVLGPVARQIDMTRLARTLSALLAAGVDIGASLDLTAGVMRLTPLRRAVRRARGGVMEGVPLSVSLGASRRFPRELIAIVATGEETGRLPEILVPLADEYELQVEYTLKDLGHLIQPIITVILGGIVLFVALAFMSVYTAMISGLVEN